MNFAMEKKKSTSFAKDGSFYLPRNATSLIQPMNPRVIACLKKHYKCRQIERAIDLLETALQKFCTILICLILFKLSTKFAIKGKAQ